VRSGHIRVAAAIAWSGEVDDVSYWTIGETNVSVHRRALTLVFTLTVSITPRHGSGMATQEQRHPHLQQGAERIGRPSSSHTGALRRTDVSYRRNGK